MANLALRASEQGSGSFHAPTTTAVTTTSGVTFQTGSTSLFGIQQQCTTFGTTFGAKSSQTGTGFTFNASTANTVLTTSTTAPSSGTAKNTSVPAIGATANPDFSTSGSFTNKTTAFGTSLTFSSPKTSVITGFTAPAATTAAAPSAFNFTSTTSGNSTSATFGLKSTATATTTIETVATTSTFDASTAGNVTASIPSTGFTLNQPAATSSLAFGVPKTTKGLTFGIPTSTFNVTATTTAFLSTNVFGTTKTTETLSGTTATTTSVGLGGIDNKQTTQGLSGAGTLEPKQTKDHTLPYVILQTLNEFQNFTKQQKSLSVEISHGSSKPLKKVQEDAEAMESLLTMITSGLTRNAIAVENLKADTAQGLHQAEITQRNHETPPGVDYDNSASADYFNDLVTKFETDTVRLRVQREASEKHLRSLTQSSTISPQELTLAMRRLHETLIVLAARVQALHTSVQSQKEQFKNIRRVYFKDDTNVFENESDQSIVKKQIYSLRSLTGPTPFSENPNTGPALLLDGLAMLGSSTCASIPPTSANPSWLSELQGKANTSDIFSGFQLMGLPGLQFSKPSIGNKALKQWTVLKLISIN